MTELKRWLSVSRLQRPFEVILCDVCNHTESVSSITQHASRYGGLCEPAELASGVCGGLSDEYVVDYSGRLLVLDGAGEALASGVIALQCGWNSDCGFHEHPQVSWTAPGASWAMAAAEDWLGGEDFETEVLM